MSSPTRPGLLSYGMGGRRPVPSYERGASPRVRSEGKWCAFRARVSNPSKLHRSVSGSPPLQKQLDPDETDQDERQEEEPEQRAPRPQVIGRVDRGLNLRPSEGAVDGHDRPVGALVVHQQRDETASDI